MGAPLSVLTAERVDLRDCEDLDFGRISGRIDVMAEKMGKYSITMPRSLAEAAREVSGDAGLSAYIANAVSKAVRHDQLGMFLAEYEELHGPISEERIAAAEAEIRRADAEQVERARSSAALQAGAA